MEEMVLEFDPLLELNRILSKCYRIQNIRWQKRASDFFLEEI